ncbi:hypothetical protein QAD02_001036 [Eretmocerus hayati]|uniref:Uncharacterized protein n=1 Tax=Eretmocerus hayati TaxID=131215 RepID=A0ACC2NHQ5_9HYME|nr:hypothetical protein QAD02_001036 [Eretmocerus hayati]
MSDVELSDLDDDVTRIQEEAGDNVDEDARSERANVSGDEVKDGDNENGEGDAQKVDPVPTKKKPVRKMVVLNTERLKGNKGVHTIEKLYQGFKFNGKGHEKEDLDRVMKRLEYWAYRIFPKLEFDDFLSKCEHLGHKKDLQTFLKRYRLGLISADDVMNEIDEDEDREEDTAIERNESEIVRDTSASDAAFQRLLDESAPRGDTPVDQSAPRTTNTTQVEMIDDSEFERMLRENVNRVEQEKENGSTVAQEEVQDNQNVPITTNTSQAEVIDDSEFDKLLSENVPEAVQEKQNCPAVVSNPVSHMEIDDDDFDSLLAESGQAIEEATQQNSEQAS